MTSRTGSFDLERAQILANTTSDVKMLNHNGRVLCKVFNHQYLTIRMPMKISPADNGLMKSSSTSAARMPSLLKTMMTTRVGIARTSSWPQQWCQQWDSICPNMAATWTHFSVGSPLLTFMFNALLKVVTTDQYKLLLFLNRQHMCYTYLLR